MAWQDDLQPASWRGVPFFVEGSDVRTGRNTAVHAYPFRETAPAWAEDLGLAPLGVRIAGFLVGDDVAAQQFAMIDAVQQAGQGELVHPMLGSLVGSIIGGGADFVTRRDRGRVVELRFDFLENAPGAPYPAAQPATQAGVTAAAAATQAAAGADYTRQAGLTDKASPNFNPRAGEAPGGT